jgi:predicted metal-dependent phosphoesterase TrpH
MYYYKLDLHTHSILSKDGGVSSEEYKKALSSGLLDYIAITDHDSIEFAESLQKELGDRIIIGEEIRTAEGEVIGLYLSKRIGSGLSLEETFFEIKKQHGLIYLPHPFCHNRSGVKQQAIIPHMHDISIIEYFNPRNTIHADNEVATKFVSDVKKTRAASSDAHCFAELGKTYNTIFLKPTKQTIVGALDEGTCTTSYTPLWHLLCPKKNRLKKHFAIR